MTELNNFHIPHWQREQKQHSLAALWLGMWPFLQLCHTFAVGHLLWHVLPKYDYLLKPRIPLERVSKAKTEPISHLGRYADRIGYTNCSCPQFRAFSLHTSTQARHCWFPDFAWFVVWDGTSEEALPQAHTLDEATDAASMSFRDLSVQVVSDPPYGHAQRKALAVWLKESLQETDLSFLLKCVGKKRMHAGGSGFLQ